MMTKLTGLWAETRYVCWAYLEDEKTTMSSAAQTSFYTSSLPEAGRLVIKFEGNVAESQLKNLREAASVAMGV
jgi:phosphopantothenate synthetase